MTERINWVDNHTFNPNHHKVLECQCQNLPNLKYLFRFSNSMIEVNKDFQRGVDRNGEKLDNLDPR